MHVSARPTELAQIPDWLTTAHKEMRSGIVERAGAEHDPRIIEYHRYTSLSATEDEVPWCSSFCCWVMEQGGIVSPKSAASLSWLRWGAPIDKPRIGCIVVFERADASGNVLPGRGHVGFWMGETPTSVSVLGGNQDNQVSIKPYPAHRVLGYRWPRTPMNSSTNLAASGVTVGSIVLAAPVAKDAYKAWMDNKDTVKGIAGEAKSLVETIFMQPEKAFSFVGLALVAFCVIHIIRERNKKIRRWGI